jgi:hypothetical protein
MGQVSITQFLPLDLRQTERLKQAVFSRRPPEAMQPKTQSDWAPIDNVTLHREPPGEAMLGSFGSIAG